jgi:hypothetical protein
MVDRDDGGGVMVPWAILFSGAAGVLATLAGVAAGSVLSSRAQKRQWSRDRQLDACAAIVAESTRSQLALRRAWRDGEKVDWLAWNQALAAVWLVGVPEVVEVAARMDELFWRQHARVRNRVLPDEAAWEEARTLMELTRLDFINAARTHVVGVGERMTRIPVSRPPLSDLNPRGETDESAS